VTAVDIATDTIRWTFSGDGQLCTSPVVAGAGHQVFIGSRNGRVYELDEMTGTQRSIHDVGAAVTCFSESNSITLADDHLLVPAGTELVVY
jgi:outer membrane protein assembly factor BamB